MLTRRSAILAMLAARPPGIIVDTHIHLFDPKRFPYHANAPYRPPAQTLESYTAFVRDAKIDHAVIVHPEPYQDDHAYLEYCIANEPAPNFFKAVCLFDPALPETPGRLRALSKRNPARIAALRIHEMSEIGRFESGGPIKNRDLRSSGMKRVWRTAADLGLMIQMHMLPRYAPYVGELAAEFNTVPVIIDHLGRAGQGDAAEFQGLLELARHPRVYMKFSGVNYSSKADYPHPDAKPLVNRLFNAFGSERMLWGGLGMNVTEFERQNRLLDLMFDYASGADLRRIRGLNAIRLFGWQAA